MPKLLLHLEGAFVLGLSLFFYARLDMSWSLFAALFLAPDLGLLGYLAGPKIGAACYNALHTYALPIVLLATGIATASDALTSISIIWAAHIGMDRMVGYGLKYSTSAKETHLQRA